MTPRGQLSMFTPKPEDTIRLKVDAALAASLSDCERAVVTMLHPRALGKLYMMSTDFMQESWRCDGLKVHDRRAVRAAIKTLIETHDLPIGSSRIPGNNGYFFCTTDDEAEDAVRHLKNEIYSLFDRIKVLSPKSAFVRGLQGQLQLLSEEPQP